MKTPIPGSVNEKGMFTAKNPYEAPNGKIIDNMQRLFFIREHPPLPCYTPSNVLVTYEEHVEVVEVWRFDIHSTARKLRDIHPTIYADFKSYNDFERHYKERNVNTDRIYRTVYLTVQPTEKSDYKLYEYYEKPTGKWWPCHMDISAFKMQGIETRLKTPIPEAQPLEGVKTAEIDKCTLTDAELIEAVNNAVSELCKTGGRSWSLSVPVNFNKDPDMLISTLVNRFNNALSAPSTHSSSEMVEVEKVVALINSHDATENATKQEIEDLITQIININK